MWLAAVAADMNFVGIKGTRWPVCFDVSAAGAAALSLRTIFMAKRHSRMSIAVRFVEVFCRSKSVEEAANEMGTSIDAAWMRALRLRQRGVKLPDLPRYEGLNSRNGRGPASTNVDFLNSVVNRAIQAKKKSERSES